VILFWYRKIPSFLQPLLSESSFNHPTPIQKQVIPIMLDQRDVMACAPTGSGKTLAFILPTLAILQKHLKAVGFRALIIVPTKELAAQIEREFIKLAGQFKICLLSKNKLAGLKASISHHFDILISTPLILIHALDEKIIDLSFLKIIVLDEADRLLENNFLEQTDRILAACPKPILKGLFTATLNSSVELLANSFMLDPVRVYVGTQNAATNTIEQELLFVGQEEGKLMAVRNLFKKGIQSPILIFMDSIERANDLFKQLLQDGIPADVIHSDKSQAEVVIYLPFCKNLLIF
jgi:ATP-dependent RNA helicase DDX52/ROK1